MKKEKIKLSKKEEEELAKTLQKIYETMKREREKAFQKFKKQYKTFREELKEFVDSDISTFIDLACAIRGIQFELQHRLMSDFIWFIIKAREEIDDAWLWSFREAFYYFWRFYQCMFEEVRE